MQPHSEPLRAILQPRLSSTLAGVQKESVRCHQKSVSKTWWIWWYDALNRIQGENSPKLRTYLHRIHDPTKVGPCPPWLNRWGSTPASSESQASVEEHQENDHENASVWEPWVEGENSGSPKKMLVRLVLSLTLGWNYKKKDGSCQVSCAIFF